MIQNRQMGEAFCNDFTYAFFVVSCHDIVPFIYLFLLLSFGVKGMRFALYFFLHFSALDG